eukprot:1454496-Pleurochrysis_carterae.AAC.2
MSKGKGWTTQLKLTRRCGTQAQEEAVLTACEEVAKGVEGARDALRAELNALRTQTVCRDFRPHL